MTHSFWQQQRQIKEMQAQNILDEKENRQNLCISAYGYEFEGQPTMSDAEWDALALKINPQMKTGKKPGDKILDDFFAEHFQPHTGQWIHNYPWMDRLAKQHKNAIYVKNLQKED